MAENNELMDMEQIREMVKSGQLVPKPADNTTSLSNTIDEQFDEFIKNDEEAQEDIKSQNKKRFKKFSKYKRKTEDDISATQRYQFAYDRETWYYKRHKDTIDKYAKKKDKTIQKKQDDGSFTVLNTKNEDETLRIGFFKMVFFVWFDLIIDFLGKIVSFPLYLLKAIVELFYNMKRSIAITVIVLSIVIMLIFGVVFGLRAFMDYMNNLTQSFS